MENKKEVKKKAKKPEMKKDLNKQIREMKKALKDADDIIEMQRAIIDELTGRLSVDGMSELVLEVLEHRSEKE